MNYPLSMQDRRNIRSPSLWPVCTSPRCVHAEPPTSALHELLLLTGVADSCCGGDERHRNAARLVPRPHKGCRALLDESFTSPDLRK